MGVSWAATLPLTRIAHGTLPKQVTLIVPYYENPEFFSVQLRHWQNYPPHLASLFPILVIDDGSPDHPAADIVRGGPVVIRLYRIEQDVRWNWIAARNIGASEAQTEWLLLTDIDHVIPPETLQSVLYGHHDPAVIYGFSRCEHTGEMLAPHPNSWLLTKTMFWTVGGYDETLSGCYGTDGDWRRRCATVARLEILTDRLIRYEYVGDSSTTRYQRKQPEDAAVKRLIAARKSGWRPKVLSFPYHRVRVE